MCGIAGWVSTLPTRFADADRTLTRMRDRLTHRGPDDAGNFLDLPENLAKIGGAALGFRRLSIIDLAGGHQPMTNEDGTVWIVFNGEIYNHMELRQELLAAGHVFANHSDTEGCKVTVQRESLHFVLSPKRTHFPRSKTS